MDGEVEDAKKALEKAEKAAKDREDLEAAKQKAKDAGSDEAKQALLQV